VKIDALLGPLESAAVTAAAAEAGGYDGLFSGEVTGDPFLPLVLAAASTERIDIGTSIAVALARSPMALAYTAWDLQRFSRGRLVLGLGSQVKAHVRRRYSMPWGRPVEQMRDFVVVMQAVWDSWATGAPLDIHTEHYTHTLMPPTFVPTQHGHGAPTVLLAGVGEAMTAMAGEVADGFLCHAFTTERWLNERTMPALRAGRARAGKTLDGFTIKATIYLATGTDQQITTAVEEIRGHLAFYASTPQYRPLLELHGWGDLGAELTTLSKTGRWAEMPALITDDMVDAFALVGAPR
jgi:probable F420-dependent oxidoreductase